jgi:hypothetical protein
VSPSQRSQPALSGPADPSGGDADLTAPDGRGLTIALALPYAVNVRDLLHTAVLRTLREGGARVVILSPAHADPSFVKAFSGPGVHLEPLFPYDPGPTEERLRTLRLTLFNDLTETINFLSTPPHERGLAKRTALACGRALARVLGRQRTQELLAAIELHVFPDRRYDEIFRRYRPDVLCVTRVIGSSPDYAVLKGAAANGIPSILLVSSWDNLTGKGVYPAKVDRMVVWNEIMAEEAVSLHDIPPQHVYACGAPQFDLYADRSKLANRETFFRRIGGDPNKALITFCLSNARMCPDEYDSLELIWKATQDGRVGRPAQVLARVHPMGDAMGRSLPERLVGLPDLLVDRPGRPGKYKDKDTGLEDIEHLAATMWHSDVVLNTASTISIDAAAFDTPIVCVGFDGNRTLSESDSVRRLHQFTHFKKLLSMGGARVGRNLEEVLGHINAYLEDPGLDREGRARIVQKQCHVLDGQASKRMGEYVLRAARELRHGR